MKRILVTAALLSASPAHAYDDIRVAQNLKDDFGNCSLYYQYVLKNINGAEPELVSQYQTTAENTLKVYMLFVKSAGENEKQAEAHLDFYNLAMKKIYNEEGFDRLFVMYSELCKQMLKNPQPRINYWKNKQ